LGLWPEIFVNKNGAIPKKDCTNFYWLKKTTSSAGGSKKL